MVSVIDEQEDAIGKIFKTMQGASKEMKLTSITMVEMGETLNNMKKETVLYANKLYHVGQLIEVSSFYNLILFCKNGNHTSYHYCYAYIYF